jgi:ribonuclease P protein component
VTARARLRFQPGLRLRRPQQFQHAYALGRKFNSEFFTANVTANSLDHPRLGLSVAARVVPTAVARNLIKRQVRSSFRLAQHELPAVDLVIGTRSAVRQATAAQLRAALAQLWERVGVACRV